MEKGAPAEIGRNIFKNLLDRQDMLPFAEIKLFCKEKHISEVKTLFGNIDIITYKELRKISKYDLIHIPVLPTVLPNAKFLLYFYIKAIKKGKLILQYHGDVRKELKSSYKDVVSLVHILTYILVPNILRSADLVVTHSYYMKKIIDKYDAEKCIVIPNAIDEFWYQKKRIEVNLARIINPNNFNIFYHGRLSWEKGIDILIEAFGHYVKNNPNATIYLAGDGPQKKYLKDLCSTLKVNEKVIFLGNINKEEIMFFLKNIDVAIYPSRFDNFPLAVLEALACANCPVYFSKRIGIYDFVIQDEFKLNSFEPEVTNLIKVLDSASCKSKNVVNKQIQFAKNYTWSHVISEYIELYRDVTNE